MKNPSFTKMLMGGGNLAPLRYNSFSFAVCGRCRSALCVAVSATFLCLLAVGCSSEPIDGPGTRSVQDSLQAQPQGSCAVTVDTVWAGHTYRSFEDCERK